MPILISHIRSAHSHESGLCFSCGVNNCPKTFRNTNTYYKHVRRAHHEKYTADTSATKKQLLCGSTSTEVPHTVDDSNSTEDISVESVADHEDDGDILTETTSVAHFESGSDTVKIASGHILKLRCKTGVTQSLLPCVVEMNEAVVDSVLTNISTELSAKLQTHGIQPEDMIATEIKEVINSHRNPLQSLHSVYRQTSIINTHYHNIVSSH